jgi:hypothetical protein
MNILKNILEDTEWGLFENMQNAKILRYLKTFPE